MHCLTEHSGNVERKDLNVSIEKQKKREVITTVSVVECSVLKDTSAADLIERFVIDNNESVLERELEQK